MLESWDEIFVSEIQYCAEKIQKHKCRPVCHKYGHINDCRFKFPKDVIEKAYYDEDEQAIIFVCKDGNVNNYNKYILVFCRHNHDLKCILSGKAAKAAMFYITDYITKMDIKTYQLLTLLSHAVLNFENDDQKNLSIHLSGKQLLHKCVSQFTKKQQIHAQQASRYGRGFGDTITSHTTVPMLSGTLMLMVQKLYPIATQTNDSHDEIETECERIPITTDNEGNIIQTNQVHNYLYRDEMLSDVCFYDFVRCFRIEKKKNLKNIAQSLPRFILLHPHKLNMTHIIVQFRNVSSNMSEKDLIPRVIGYNIPRPKTEELYHQFMLSHFKPFSITNKLVKDHDSFQSTFSTYSFNKFHLQIINNWEEIHLCEDMRDAERLKKTRILPCKRVKLLLLYLIMPNMKKMMQLMFKYQIPLNHSKQTKKLYPSMSLVSSLVRKNLIKNRKMIFSCVLIRKKSMNGQTSLNTLKKVL